MKCKTETNNPGYPPFRRRILLANCPQEAECQVMPCNAVPSATWSSITVNSVLNSSTTCMCHVCMLLSLRVLYMYCRAPCRALSMNLEPSTTESNYLHTCLYCVPRVSARGLICAWVYLVYFQPGVCWVQYLKPLVWIVAASSWQGWSQGKCNFSIWL